MLTHLLLMRHAKSSWDDPTQTDHERTLNARGEVAAPAVGKMLHARGYAPQLIWSSDSTRTRQTATLLIRAIPGAQSVIHSSGFYHASALTVLDIAADMGEPKNVERLMWLGHNPGWSELFAHFTGHEHNFPTGACAVLKRKIRTENNWLDPESWKLIDMILPRDLTD